MNLPDLDEQDLTAMGEEDRVTLLTIAHDATSKFEDIPATLLSFRK
jgi:hypothetical protein